ncbi:oligosaccharide flippase family protein [Pseudomonas sp.]|uniref:oligosaccharide flippase family protein n=1 Tax=Gammaproteobacteria TaxID=1236 RepID=UPI0028B06EB7|nr:oligosaccharide flippase family protein [Pseudomonas sp.]
MSLKRNSIFSAIEVVVNGLGLFFIYRGVVQHLGLSDLGVWSIVLATTAFGRVADVGIASGLARFIATSNSRSRHDVSSTYFSTALISIFILMGVVALLGWIPLSYALRLTLDGTALSKANALLPWALLTFWLLNLNAVVAAALLGIQRSDLRATASIAGMALQVVASHALISTHGLEGLAWAQAAQYVLSLSLGFAAIHWASSIRASARIDRSTLKELIGFGAKLQAGTIANLVFEPTCKLILGVVSGPAAVGLFEMAYRMVYQVRGVAVMSAQNLVPAFASAIQDGPSELAKVFRRGTRACAVASTVLMCGVTAGSPLASKLWLGRVDPLFCQLTAILCVCWAINIISAPSYFLGIARGTVNANISGQILTALLAPFLAYAFGLQGGIVLATVGITAGKMAGDILPLVLNRPDGITIRAAALNPSIIAATTCVALCALGMYVGSPNLSSILSF